MDNTHQSLAQLPKRQHAIVADIDLHDEDAIRLKVLGICSGRSIEIIQSGDPLIVRVHGSRVGLALRLAERVMVRPA
jgi:Fe2+ transport system protein FeoA